MTNLPPHTNEHGFSLVEALVAIAILLTVVSGVMLLVNQSIQSGQNVSNRLSASYLASDAIEYLRYDRDSNWLSDNQDSFQDWLDNLPDCENFSCRVDTRKGEGKVEECSGSCPNLRYFSGDFTYGYGGGEESRFKRTVEFVSKNDIGPDDPNVDEVVVKITVTWPASTGGDGELVLTDTLSSWGD